MGVCPILELVKAVCVHLQWLQLYKMISRHCTECEQKRLVRVIEIVLVQLALFDSLERCCLSLCQGKIVFQLFNFSTFLYLFPPSLSFSLSPPLSLSLSLSCLLPSQSLGCLV